MEIGRIIRRRRQELGMTLEELAGAVGTSKQTVFRYESGEIVNIPRARIEGIARALKMTPGSLMGWESASLPTAENILPLRRRAVPLLGQIACGEPIYAEEEFQGYAIAEDGITADFCLRASGDSMIGARIYDGDIVFVKACDTVENGEIGVVIIEDEATLKRVYYDPADGKLILSPENPRYRPLVYSGEELSAVKILGRAVAFQSTVR